jgi:hypothetical protein
MNINPFDLNDQQTYQLWRDKKLENYPQKAEELIVEIHDQKSLTKNEHQAILERCQKTNMAIYASSQVDENKELPRLLGEQFGLKNLDNNPHADEDAISAIQVTENRNKGAYIPYTNRPIHWHTDGYYNEPEKQIRGMVLHCVRPSFLGGENALLDHEIAYILLRDKNPDFIRALMQADAMTIPPNDDENTQIRGSRSGSVFSVDENRHLHLRYTKRKRSIIWKENTLEAVKYLESILDDLKSPYIFRATLQAGWGLICNNVLHDRSGFEDHSEKPRLLYRARYYQRISGT